MKLRFFFKIIFSSFLILQAFSSCSRERIVLYDFACYVNGQPWQMSNPDIVLSRYDYRIIASRSFSDSSLISIRASPDEGKEVILNDFNIDIHEFEGVGLCNKGKIEMYGSAIGKVDGSFTYMTTYHLDKTKDYGVFINKYELDSGATRGDIEGRFTGTLKADNGPDGKNPEYVSVTSGRFACPVRIW
jgi:hypothetical protein